MPDHDQRRGPGALAPSDLTIVARDGVELHGRLWPSERRRAVVVLSHGYGEHSGAYEHVAAPLARRAGVDILGFDYRGHGRSPGKRGVVRDYAELLGDLRAAIDRAATDAPGLPRFVLGHSNGALVALCLAADGLDCAGLILSNPALQLAVPVPPWKLAAGRWLRRFAPGVTLDASISGELLSRDPVMKEARGRDALRHDRISGPLFFGLVENGREIREKFGAIGLPLLMLVGEDDGLIDPGVSARAFDRIGSADKTLIRYPGGRHELFNDLIREAVIDDVVGWLDGRLGSA